MMGNKEIIKALECCIKAKTSADCEALKCPFYDNEIDVCMYVNNEEVIYANALDLINRQQSAIDMYMQENDRLKTAYIQVSEDRNEIRKETEAEIEMLREENNAMREDITKAVDELKKAEVLYTEDITSAKSEAIKEFANEFGCEILHKKFWNYHPYTSQAWLNGYEQCMRDMRVMLKDKLKEMVGEDNGNL